MLLIRERFFNVLNNLIIDCDIDSPLAEPKVKDIGVVKNLDTVAID
jgi:uncharacterized Fe-S center protein